MAPERADAWRAAGFTVTALSDADLASREALPSPGTAPRAGLASPTRSPWVVANGWRFTRHPGAKYVYDVPAGKAALAAAEAFAYGADAVLRIDPADVGTLGEMLTFLEALPAVDLPTVSELAIVDDGSADHGRGDEPARHGATSCSRLSRRRRRDSAITIRIGTPEYPREEAADPSALRAQDPPSAHG